MKQVWYAILATTALAWGGAAMAQAANCADEIGKVDSALSKAAKSPRADDVRKLRDEADKLQNEGKSTECLATIERAKAMLGIR